MKETDITINVLQKEFKVFEPGISNPSAIPAWGGNYIFVLKEGSELPIIDLPCVMHKIDFKGESLDVIYTGIGCNLHERIIKKHFGNNAGRSTLRKSLGSLMGLEKVQRDKKQNGKTKFKEEDERRVSEWMAQNLLVFVAENPNFEEDEQRFIDYLNPPLNLDKNHNAENAEYRQRLSALRSSGETKRTVNKPKNIVPMNSNTTNNNKGKYIDLWKKCLPKIKEILMGNSKAEYSFSLCLEDFANCGGNRNKYSFRLEMENGNTNNISGNAVARDLYSVIQADKTLWEFQKENHVIIRMNTHFEVFVSRL